MRSPGAGDGDRGDRHRPSSARRGAARLPDPAPGVSTVIRSPICAGRRLPGSWPALCVRRPGMPPGPAEDDLDLVAPGDRRRRGAADRREPLAGAPRPGGDAAGAAPWPAGAAGGRALRAEPPRRGRSRLPPRPADQRRRAALSRRRRGRAVADRRRRPRRARSPPSWTEPTRSGAVPSARSTPLPRRRGASCPTSCAKPTVWSSPARVGTPAWSGSSPRVWSSATTARWLSISLDGKGGGRGSGRSIPGFDLLAGAARPARSTWRRFGGHRAAAGLELQAERPGRLSRGVRRPRDRGARARRT